MLLESYNLREQPFGVTPDTRFLYLNHMYCEALASLWYGIEERRGFLALIAHPGMGKTTLLFHLLQRLRRTSARTAFLFQTCCSADDLIRYLLIDLGIWPSVDAVSMRYQLNETLSQEARAGRQVVFVIDEAQNLSAATLESVRLLSDFETSQGKLLQIILAGQPQLVNTLMKPEMLQLTQRLSVTTFLDPLDAEDVERYIRHRLGVAGYQGKPLFTPDALRLVVEESQGIPRNINNICFGAISTAFALNQRRIDRGIVESVAADQSMRSLSQRLISLEHQSPQSQRPELLETSARTAQTTSIQRRSIASGIGPYARLTACLLAFLFLVTPSVAKGVQPAAARVLVSVENRPISAATATEAVTSTEAAIQVGLPIRFSDDLTAMVEPQANAEPNLSPIFEAIHPPDCDRDRTTEPNASVSCSAEFNLTTHAERQAQLIAALAK
jgi:general secretion pathway protein A